MVNEENIKSAQGLKAKLREIILDQGPISFEHFMRLCLYDEAYGFYRKRQVLGKTGHFFTNIQVSHLYGQLIAQQILEMAEAIDKSESFTLVEQGAHDGQFAIDILRWCRDFAPDFYAKMNCLIIEPWKEGQIWQQQNLREAKLDSKVCHVETIESIEPNSITGLFLSHELVDAFPVHRVIFHQDQWQEIYVTWHEEKGLEECYQPILNEKLKQEVKYLSLPAVEGYETEISLNAKAWMGEIAHRLKKGFVMTVDYGFAEEEYYASHRVRGTITAYHHHQRKENFYVACGEQDLTAHVNFSLLKREGEKNGLALVGYTDQSHFLTGIVQEELFTLEKNDSKVEAAWIKAFQTLTHPNLMGSQFKVLCLSKNLPAIQLKGFLWLMKLL